MAQRQATTIDGAPTGRHSRNWWRFEIDGTVNVVGGYTTGCQMSDGILSVNGTITIDGASPLSSTFTIGGGYTHDGTTATITDAGILNVNGISTLAGTVAIGGGYTANNPVTLSTTLEFQCKWNYNRRESFDLSSTV